MPPKKRTPSNSNSTPTNTKSPSLKSPTKSTTPIPDFPLTSPVSPSSKSTKKHVKIHPETQIETFEIDEPIRHVAHVEETAGSAMKSPVDKKGAAVSPSTILKENISHVVVSSAAKPTPLKFSSFMKTAAPVGPSKATRKQGKYYRDEATIKSMKTRRNNGFLAAKADCMHPFIF